MVADIPRRRVGVCWSLVRGALRVSRLFPIHLPKSFKELAGYAKDEQKRLLQVASKEAFRCWRSVLPVISFALVLSGGIALGRTLPKATALPDTWWVHDITAALFAGAAGWFVMRLAVSCVRPFLQKLLERTNNVA